MADRMRIKIMGEHMPIVSTRGSRKHRKSRKGDSVINETTENISSHGNENECVMNVKKVPDTNSDREVSLADDGGNMLLPRYNDQEILSEQDDEKGKEMGCTDKEIQHSNEICDPVGHTVTQERKQEKDQALNYGGKNKMHTAAFDSQAEVDEEIIDIGSTSVHKYSCEINTCSKSEANIGPQFGITAESDDNICSFIFIGQDKMQMCVKDVFIGLCSNKMYFDDVNRSALENEPAAVSKNSIVVKHPHLALIINSECMRLVLQEGRIFSDCQINAAVMETKSCIFCTDRFVTYEIPLSFILALFHRRCMLKTSFLNALKTLSLCHVSPELPAIDANKDLDDKTLSLCVVSPELLETDANIDLDDKVCCVYCAEEKPVKNVEDLKNGQHLTRPGQSHHSWCFSGSCISYLLSFLSFDFPFYRHHLLLKDIVSYLNQTAMLTLIHRTKIGAQIDIFETVESCYIPDENLRVVQYNQPKYPTEAVIHSAESSLNFCREAKPDSYSLCLDNCEHTIREFVVGKKVSLQVQNFIVIIVNILVFIFCITLWFMSGYIRMFTFVAFCNCIFYIYLALDLSTHCKKYKIMCGSCLKDNRIRILCLVTFWTLFIFYHEKMCPSSVLDIGCITCVFISSLK